MEQSGPGGGWGLYVGSPEGRDGVWLDLLMVKQRGMEAWCQSTDVPWR